MCEDALKLVSMILISPFQHRMFHDPQGAVTWWEMKWLIAGWRFGAFDLRPTTNSPYQTSLEMCQNQAFPPQIVLLCAWCCLEEFGLWGASLTAVLQELEMRT